jgi:hypothetical protein
LKRNFVPSDSILRLWLHNLGITEIPVSYQVVIGLSLIGALLKRGIYVDQEEWRVYPNLSVLLVGPSGIGKDVVINKAGRVIEYVNPSLTLGVTTIEFLKSAMVEMGDPAACYVPANELSAFLGTKDYQKGIAKELTDLLSTNDRVVLGTKGEGKLVIHRPTLVLHAGSTVDWLQDLPDNSLSGGFLPRFVIVCEEYGSRHVAWVKYDYDKLTRMAAREAGAEFKRRVKELVGDLLSGTRYRDERELTPTKGAEEFYRNWYHNRFNYFSVGVKAYANRSRDQMHRLAMLMAVSRGHTYLEETDYTFAADLMDYIAKGIDGVVAPMLKRRRQR